MPTFKDKNDREWRVEWDGLLLADVLSETGVDLADLSAGGLALIHHDHIKMTQVLVVLLRDEIKSNGFDPKTFSKALKGNVFTAAFAAVLGAAADFFPSQIWSEVRQSYETRLDFREKISKAIPMVGPLLETINRSEMESIRPDVLLALKEMLGGIDLMQFLALSSAGGPVRTPSQPHSNTPENAESAPAA